MGCIHVKLLLSLNLLILPLLWELQQSMCGRSMLQVSNNCFYLVLICPRYFVTYEPSVMFERLLYFDNLLLLSLSQVSAKFHVRIV